MSAVYSASRSDPVSPLERATQRRNTAVALWLLACCALVFAMVVLGGVTRLTGSGLSMVDWRPVTGILPPLTEADWQRSFTGYQQSPEFQKINSSMDLAAYQGIFWLEYLHRLLGRLIGLAFFLPMIFFLARGYIAPSQWPKYFAMFVLGGLQGLLGWYMVKSGLVDNPHVSQYRLTAHLVAAFTIYAVMFWVAQSLLFPPSGGPRHPWYGRALALLCLLVITVISGGFVAGLKAGYAYNTFPLMGGEWIPYGILSFEPWWRNPFENLVTVQFDHRWLAVSALCAVVTFYLAGRGAGFPRRARIGARVMLGLVCVQVALGISTLIWHVPLVLASAHQATALLLFTSALWVCHALRGGDRAPA